MKKWRLATVAVIALWCASSAIGSNGAVITSVSYMFEAFSPYSMIRFFEFNDRGWNISENCLRDMYNFLEGLKKGSEWAVKLYDASSYYSGGAYGANRLRINNPKICRLLQNEYESMLTMHWNLRLNTTVVPFPVHAINAKYDFGLANSVNVNKIHQLICFPSSCQHADLMEIMDIFMFEPNNIVRNLSLDGIRTIDEKYKFFDDGSFFALIILFGITITTFVLTSLTQVCNLKKKVKKDVVWRKKIFHDVRICDFTETFTINPMCVDKNGNYPISCDENKKSENPEKVKINLNCVGAGGGGVKSKNVSAPMCLDIVREKLDAIPRKKCLTFGKHESLAKSILNAFNISSVISKMLSSNNEEAELAVLCGLQVLCTVTYVFAHTFIIMAYISNNTSLESTQDVRKNETYLMDVFFFISGANLTHLFFKTSLRISWKVFEQLFHFVAMIAFKVCSLILPYTVALIAVDLVSKHFYSNTVLEIPSLDYRNCDANKWRNVLFIETFIPLQERCMPWTWFVSLEVHFYIAACLVLMLAQVHPKYAGAICTFLFFTSIIASTVLEMDPANSVTVTNTPEDEIININLIFEKIWLRIPPYILGMCLGYILHKTKGKFDMNVVVIVLGWIACLFILAGFIFGLQSILFGVNPWIRATVITLSHAIWSMILFWIILASISKYGEFLHNVLSHHHFFTLSKLSGCTHLIAPLIIRVVLLLAEEPINISEGFHLIMSLGFTVVAYCVAFPLHVMFEAPLVSILKIIYDRHFL